MAKLQPFKSKALDHLQLTGSWNLDASLILENHSYVSWRLNLILHHLWYVFHCYSMSNTYLWHSMQDKNIKWKYQVHLKRDAEVASYNGNIECITLYYHAWQEPRQDKLWCLPPENHGWQRRSYLLRRQMPAMVS